MKPITFTPEELLRMQVVQRVVDGDLRYADAAQALNLSRRQVMRLAGRLRTQGPGAFVSSKRGRPSNHRLAPDIRECILALVRTEYRDFGPTFLSEKLAERQGIIASRETLRKLLITEKLHRARKRRLRPRPMRERRAIFGELTQVDGSPHAWFEERGKRCCLLLANDDATSAILAARFEPAETTDGYFSLFREYFTAYGLPEAIYSDKHSIFRISHGTKVNNETQVQRALRELNIGLFCANSPQAKGRVERANRTLQDRLLKELRLHNISTIAEANPFLPAFIADYNRRFAKESAQPGDAHRTTDQDLARILVRRYTRKLTKDLTFQLGDSIYAIDPTAAHRLRKGIYVTITCQYDGTITAWRQQQALPTRYLGKRQRNARIVSSKNLDAALERIPLARPGYTPAPDHPWKRQGQRSWNARQARLKRTQG